MGVNASWELTDKVTPVIPRFQRANEVFEKEFDMVHSKKHTLPTDKHDIRGVENIYTTRGIFSYKPERSRKGTEEINDAYSTGQHQVLNTNWLPELHSNRTAYEGHFNDTETYDCDIESLLRSVEEVGPQEVDEVEACMFAFEVDFDDEDLYRLDF